ncbi:hypothetical protein L1049_002521 [Liquidambar formosana]|uniref:Uncharacterized protein n=1 Tax=Liquidambar formosana TaxID=63359 RepID=A0AAP0NI07_LIQFO
MKGKVKSGFCVALLAMMMVVMAHCRANASLTNNDNSRGCNGPVHECDSQLELLLDTEINVRLLAEVGVPVTTNTFVPTSPVANCGRNTRNTISCLQSGKNNCRDLFDRNCGLQ